MAVSLINQHYSEYFKQYTKLVTDNSDVIDALMCANRTTNEIIDLVTEKQGCCAYEEGKWTIKELLVHLIDTERIFCNRALRFARNDKTDLPGYDHIRFAINSEANSRNLCELIREYNIVRKGTMALFNSFSDKMLEREGSADGNQLTVLAIGYIIAGHETHHTNVLEEKYLD